jgi:hypothetical protein
MILERLIQRTVERHDEEHDFRPTFKVPPDKYAYATEHNVQVKPKQENVASPNYPWIWVVYARFNKGLPDY